ncbi:MBOAT family O-acyltransferase [Flavobacterium aciduliphilum]|uniref:D-alanyl-lipoteichoic acid acyltransferase DltB (MBOAT superfamily) n=1 Tax=Flavobacterium aciduliphilum TaxID=1101402 RepID=A0A328Y7P3_9FLAO|nr:MBOAT family O-acyltransferase [Flavobacterium aciduliphilum]RAR69303.1 D-alanyl-lipoteichoic acid acyltransferase DltB (MBOAT superfamily) [Flavobacterium aciduliphilum]
MLFNSIDFLIFLPIVFFFYWFITKNSLKFQNLLLLVASYYFYACWDWRFLFLLMFSTFLDYYTGLKMQNTTLISRKKFWFWLSIFINLGFLAVFKYYNFFAKSLVEGLNLLNIKANLTLINVILPVGISFYTFHGLSYVIDIYKNRIKAEKNFTDYAVFVSFFPLLVAGPIERATHLLPQIKKKREFDYYKAVDGLKQILWGVFKKVVIADNCAEIANEIFNNYGDYSGSSLVLGALCFTFQIYGDFSGYSDIALGTAKLFGIDLLRNFAFPYFSRDVAEFWRRWHISLSSWFKDYLYIPLGGSKGSMWIKIRNTFIIFIVSGFWHGANWTFIVWGLLNAIFIMPSIIFNTNRNNIEIVAKGANIPSFKDFLSIFFTFCLTVFAWIFFRSDNLKAAIVYVKNIFSITFFTIPKIQNVNNISYTSIMVIFFLVIEWIGREDKYAIETFGKKYNKKYKYLFYYLIVFLIIYYGNFNKNQFIYFQF